MHLYKVSITDLVTTEWGDVRKKYVLKFMSITHTDALKRALVEAKKQGFKNLVAISIINKIPINPTEKKRYRENFMLKYCQEQEKNREKSTKPRSE
jgi:hypothetical protein